MTLAQTDYAQWLQTLKEQIRTARIKASLAVNSELIRLYWRLGREILARQDREGWGAKVIDQLAKDLRSEFPDMKGLSPRNMKYMRAFAQAWSSEEFVQQLAAQIPWFHHCTLLDKIKDQSLREWYVRKTTEHGWSRSILEMQIESQAHRRFGAAQTNFERTLPAPQSDLARDLLKDPYAFDFLGLTDSANERAIEKGLVQHLRDFLIELKNTEFKFEYTGQLNGYLAAVDDLVRDPAHDAPTIGLILCKSKKKTMVEYALRGVQTPMGVSTYRTALPDAVAQALPSIEVLAAEIERLPDIGGEAE
jgi:predicted nuclease of restriction endonuclease-like (RecB) superfamily